MAHLIIELGLWMLLAYIAGCIIGHVLGVVSGNDEEARLVSAGMPPLAEAVHRSDALQDRMFPVEAPFDPTEAEPLTEIPVALVARPRGITAPRAGRPDNLQRIVGIGPKNERTLHGLGIFHFDQIAAWTEQEIAWVDNHLKFNGRIMREEWIEQARLLTEGKETEFRQRYGDKTKPGGRNRRS